MSIYDSQKNVCVFLQSSLNKARREQNQHQALSILV